MDETNRNNSEDEVNRTGTVITASAHIITGVIGSGVLSLAWAIAQLGWLVGPPTLLVFALITWFASKLLADCYRFPDPVFGTRNRTYMDAVNSVLGGRKVTICGCAQYASLVGSMIGYTITASTSIATIIRTNCFHNNGHQAPCHASNTMFTIIFGCVQIFLSQMENFHGLSWLSKVSAVMSFTYSCIGIGLSVAKVAEKGHQWGTTLTGVSIGVDVSSSEKVWRTFQAIGNIAFAYDFSTILIEIQDTLRQSPPENEVMKKASLIGVSTTTLLYMLCGCMGYAAFGNHAPGNLLSGFGFYEPFWLLDVANICIVIQLIGSFQVCCQPFFGFVENRCSQQWPGNRFLRTKYVVNVPFYGLCHISLFRLYWRTGFIILTTLVAILFPFFNDILGLIGAICFWPMTVYLPVEMYLRRTQVQRFSPRWILLQLMVWLCLIVSIVAFVGSVMGLTADVKTYKPFS